MCLYVPLGRELVPSERYFLIAGTSYINNKRRGGMKKGIGNAIMSCKYWLGFYQITQEDMKVKAYIGILGNERADECARFFTKIVGPEAFTDSEIKQPLTARRKSERAQVG